MKLKIFNGRARFRQWDVNQRLICEGVTPGTQIHFSSDGEKALVVESYELDGRTIANVPNILLQNTAPIHVYVYLRESDEKYTKYEIVYSVLARPKPDDYVYTETETLSYSDLDKRITSLEDNLEEAVKKAIEDAIKNGDIDIPDGTEVDIDAIVQQVIEKLSIDDALSATSTNPVQNKVIAEIINEIVSSLSTLGNNFYDHVAEYEGKVNSFGQFQQEQHKKIIALEEGKQDKLEFAEAIDNEEDADKVPTAGVVLKAFDTFSQGLAIVFATKEELNALSNQFSDILTGLHNYAQTLKGGDA